MKKILSVFLLVALFFPAYAMGQAFNSYTNTTTLNSNDEFAIYCPNCTLSQNTKMRNWTPSQLLLDSTTLATPLEDMILFYDFSAGKYTALNVGSGLSISGTTLSSTGLGGTVTSVDVSGGSTGLSFSGGPITSSGTITASGTLAGANGGTGVNNTGKTITLGGNLSTSGANDTTLTTTGSTDVTLPTTGTLSTLAGTETLTNKTISGASNTLSNIPPSSVTVGAEGSNLTVSSGVTSWILPATQNSSYSDAGTLAGTEKVSLTKSGDTTTMYSTTTLAIAKFVATNFTTACKTTATRDLCSAAMGYADPRWYGAYCGSQFNVNWDNEDDAAGIQAALDSGAMSVGPITHCKIANRVLFKQDGQTLFGWGNGSRYNSNYAGNEYVFIPNNLWINKATSYNCAIDSNGYDNVKIKNIAFRGNYSLFGSTVFCNAYSSGSGIRSPRAAAFMDIENVSVLNLGNGVGTSMVSYGDDNPATPGTPYGADTPCTPVSTGTGFSYMYGNVYQLRIRGFDVIGSCMGIYANFTDAHITDMYGGSVYHNAISGLAGYGGSGVVSSSRFEYSGLGAGPSGSKTYYNGGAAVYYDSPMYLTLQGISYDHNYGDSVRAGPSAKNIVLTDNISLGAHYNAPAGTGTSCHFSFQGADGINAKGITTYRNGVNTDYVACFENASNTYIDWSGTGGGQGSGAATGQWNTSYFKFGSGAVANTISLHDIVGWSTGFYSGGNSGTAYTFNLENGPNQYITETGNATITLPTIMFPDGIQLALLTGAGGFTPTISGVEWVGGVAPTFTTTASSVDVLSCLPNYNNTAYRCAVQLDVQ